MSGMAFSVRPMEEGDVEGVALLAGATFDDQDAAAGHPVPVPYDDPVRLASGVVRAGAAVASDPAGVFVAEDAAGLLGAAVALRRGGLWVLSLLVVRPGSQGRGVGARLLAAARQSEAGADAGLIFSSHDPRALRSYAGAGFALQPAFKATGTVELAVVPAGGGVRPGSARADVLLCEDVSRAVRGVEHFGDLATMERMGHRLLVADDGGFAMVRGGSVTLCAARSESVARRLLWASLVLASSAGEVTVGFMTAAQQWALDVCLSARLSLSAGSSVCTKGAVGPMAPYLPSGVFG